MSVNEQICRNVKALCKINCLRVMDVEKGMGRNPGFLSRNPKLSADEIVYLAKNCGVTVQDLMEKDFAAALDVQIHEEKIYESIANMRDDLKAGKDEMMKTLIRLCNTAYGGEIV